MCVQYCTRRALDVYLHIHTHTRIKTVTRRRYGVCVCVWRGGEGDAQTEFTLPPPPHSHPPSFPPAELPVATPVMSATLEGCPLLWMLARTRVRVQNPNNSITARVRWLARSLARWPCHRRRAPLTRVRAGDCDRCRVLPVRRRRRPLNICCAGDAPTEQYRHGRGRAPPGPTL